jgi:uncharacterized protein (DUF302 family)
MVDGEITTKSSPRTVAETVQRLEAMLQTAGLTLFAVIDQQAAALQAGLDLRETVLVIFGSPAAGTPVMEEVPLSAVDLPLKLLVWRDGEQTRVSYTSPPALAARYGLGSELAHNLAGIDAISDKLIQD